MDKFSKNNRSDESTSLQIVKPASELPLTKDLQPKDTTPQPATSQEMRVVEVTEALTPAYQKASTLELTDEEIAALCKPFSDDAVEIRPHDGLIYIPHIAISDRLNQVLKPGKWALICRRHWFDDGTQTMYGEYVMLIRGCCVGESVGGHPYVRNNPKTNYSDALESTAAEALRRIAGKRLSCGSQVWQPEYCRQWRSKYAERVGGKWQRKTNFPMAKPNRPPKPEPPKEPDIDRDAYLAKLDKLCANLKPQVLEYLQTEQDKHGVTWLMPNEDFQDLKNSQLKMLVDYWPKVMPKIEAWMQKQDDVPMNADSTIEVEPDKPEEPADPFDDVDSTDADAWRQFPMPFGKNAGIALEELDKKYLYGLWANYEVEEEYNGKRKTEEQIEKDTLFREMLDLCGQHYQFTKK